MGMPLDVKMFLHACDQKQSPENAALYKSLMEEEYKEFMNDIVAEVKISKAAMELETKEKLNSMLNALISVASLAA